MSISKASSHYDVVIGVLGSFCYWRCGHTSTMLSKAVLTTIPTHLEVYMWHLRTLTVYNKRWPHLSACFLLSLGLLVDCATSYKVWNMFVFRLEDTCKQSRFGHAWNLIDYVVTNGKPGAFGTHGLAMCIVVLYVIRQILYVTVANFNYKTRKLYPENDYCRVADLCLWQFC